IFGFAGFYSEWQNPQNGENIISYTIATTEANELMEEIHNNKKRMPIILKKEDRNEWLKGGALENSKFPYEVAAPARLHRVALCIGFPNPISFSSRRKPYLEVKSRNYKFRSRAIALRGFVHWISKSYFFYI